jgi:hypothetical protein
MSSQNLLPQLSLQSLINLTEELEEIGNQLDEISLGFDTGEIDYAGFELALLQLRDCQGQLEEMLNVHPVRP